MVNDVDELYQRILEKKGKVLSPPKDMEWGMREMLVEDPEGHIIRFGRGSTSGKKSESLPAGIRIVERLPTTGEYEALIQSVGWKGQPGERTEKVLNARCMPWLQKRSKQARPLVVYCCLVMAPAFFT